MIVPLHPSVGQIYASFWDIKNFLLAYRWIIVSSSEGKFGNDHFFICHDKDKKVAIVVNISRDNRKFIITNVRTVPYELFAKRVYKEQLRQGAMGGNNVQ